MQNFNEDNCTLETSWKTYTWMVNNKRYEGKGMGWCDDMNLSLSGSRYGTVIGSYGPANASRKCTYTLLEFLNIAGLDCKEG